MKRHINIMICLVFFIFNISCTKDSCSIDKWQVIDLKYDGELTDMFVLNDDTIFILSYMDKLYQNTVLFQTNDGGITWNKKTFPKVDEGGFRSIYCLNASTIYASGVHGLYQTLDGGNSWILVGLEEEMESGIIYFFDRTVGFVGRGSSILKTIDGGISFIKVFDVTTVMTFKQFQFFNEQLGYASGGSLIDFNNYGIIVKTLDKGSTWEVVPKQFQNILSMCFISSSVGFVTTLNGVEGAKLLKTTDAGETWISLNENLYQDYGILPDCYFYDEYFGFLYGGNKILSTFDGGNTWTEEFVGDSSKSPIKLIITKSKTAYALCQNSYFLKRNSRP